MSSFSGDTLLKLQKVLEENCGDEAQAILHELLPGFIHPQPLPPEQLIPDEVVERLMEAGANRQVRDAVNILKELAPQLTTASLPQKHAAVIMSYAAWAWASDL